MIKASILLFILFSITAYSQQAELSEEQISDHILYLSSESLAGRKPGKNGDKLAAEYIRQQFSKSKCQLLGENGFQYFQLVTEVKSGDNNQLIINNTSYTLYEDFIPYSFTSNAQIETTVCFAGYGFNIKEDSTNWNDFENIDVKGKWIMILRADPEIDNQNSVFIPYSHERSKIVHAKDNGAAGVLFVTGKNLSKKDKLIKLSYDKNPNDAGIPVINITRKIANTILEPSGIKIDSLENDLRKNHRPNSFEIPTNVKVSTDIIMVKDTSQNVVAMIPGNDENLKEEYIIVGAHYDHLGFGGANSGSRVPDTTAIHPGADDNASGIAGILELAEIYGIERNNKRSMIFIAFGAEEMGLIGSKYFTENPLVEKERIYSMINFDMIGRLQNVDPYISVGGTGTAAEFDSLVDLCAKHYDFKIQKDPSGYGPSDHTSFYSKKIPVLYISTGAHADYHTPDDNWDNINTKGELLVISFAYNLIEKLHSTPKLHFTESGSKSNRSNRSRLKVVLGIIPDVASSNVKGLRVTGVRKNGPAHKGGLLANDIITGINGQKITNIYEYMARLAELEAGVTAIVEIERDGATKVFLIQL